MQQNSSNSNSNISKTVSYSIINNYHLKCVTRSSGCIYVNCFNRLRLLAEVSTKVAKNALF